MCQLRFCCFSHISTFHPIEKVVPDQSPISESPRCLCPWPVQVSTALRKEFSYGFFVFVQPIESGHLLLGHWSIRWCAVFNEATSNEIFSSICSSRHCTQYFQKMIIMQLYEAVWDWILGGITTPFSSALLSSVKAVDASNLSSSV